VRSNLIAALLGVLCITGCGGGGGGGSSVGAPTSGGTTGGSTTGTSSANVQSVTVDSGPSEIASSSSPAVNTLYTTITVCAPGTATCQTIDHIQVDTGSSGLRILASVLTISLPVFTDSSGQSLAECVQFVDGSSFGPLRKADLKIASEVAGNVAVQVIGDPSFPVPSGCMGTAENSVTAFGANGILGVGPFLQDCGSACTVQGNGIYYSCPTSSTCADTALALAQQVSNPVAFFPTDNNGVIIQLPEVKGTAPSVSGSLIFGIGTQGNNGLGTATVFQLTDTGGVGTTYKGNSLADSFIDSGSNAYFFPDSIPTCSTNKGFYCPTQTQSLTGTITGTNSASASVAFTVANADTLFGSGATVAAAPALAGSSTSVNNTSPSSFNGSKTFDWGLPFYFGRSVYTAIEGQNTANGGVGPYFAF
jgi:hypothetical protein